MITIDPKFKKDIQRIRQAHKSHNDMIDYFIQKIGERAGLKTVEEQEVLWDHVLNETSWTVEYKKGKNESTS